MEINKQAVLHHALRHPSIRRQNHPLFLGVEAVAVRHVRNLVEDPELNQSRRVLNNHPDLDQVPVVERRDVCFLLATPNDARLLKFETILEVGCGRQLGISVDPLGQHLVSVRLRVNPEVGEGSRRVVFEKDVEQLLDGAWQHVDS